MEYTQIELLEQQAIKFIFELRSQEYSKDSYNLTNELIEVGLI